MSKLQESVNGQALADIALDAYQPAMDDAVAEWPVLTGASRDSIILEVVEVAPRYGRVALQVGGEILKNDPRNKSGRDYAPFIEFNGTPNAVPGILFRAVNMNIEQIRRVIHAKVAELVRGSL
jgi:hypothetical protein